MSKTIVVYGSSTGTCEAIAEKIAQKLGCEAIDVQNLTADVVNNNQNLILGTSTWGAGELQDDWYDGLKVLQGADLTGKTIAPFLRLNLKNADGMQILPAVYSDNYFNLLPGERRTVTITWKRSDGDTAKPVIEITPLN